VKAQWPGFCPGHSRLYRRDRIVNREENRCRWLMQRFARLLVILIACAPLSACGDFWLWLLIPTSPPINLVVQLRPVEANGIGQHRAILVYGLADEAHWNAPPLGLDFDEYSMDRGEITATCGYYNRTQAAIPSGTTAIQYFAFSVPAGYYVFGVLNRPLPEEPYPSVAVEASEGSVVYIGDFFNEANPGNRETPLTPFIFKVRQNIEAARKSSPLKGRLAEAMVPARLIPVDRGTFPVVCTL
jgi:hypothetical protein